MWTNQSFLAAQDYRHRIKKEISAQISTQFIYFLLQESTRLLQELHDKVEKKLYWWHSDYRKKNSFLQLSKKELRNFNALSSSHDRYQYTIVLSHLATMNELLIENSVEDYIVSFVTASKNAISYTDFSGKMDYTIRSATIKLYFDFCLELYQKKLAELSQRVDELEMLPHYRHLLGLDIMPQTLNGEGMWITAAYPLRLATRQQLDIDHSAVNSKTSIVTLAHKQYKRCNALRIHIMQYTAEIKKHLASLCRVDESSSLDDIKQAAKRIKQFTFTQRTGRASILRLVGCFKELRQFDHDFFIQLHSQKDLQKHLHYLSEMKITITERLTHLKKLLLMQEDLPLLDGMSESFEKMIICMQHQAHSYVLESQFIAVSSSMPMVNVGVEMQQSLEATEWQRLRHYLIDIAKSYHVSVPANDQAHQLHIVLDSIATTGFLPGEENMPSCVLDPDKILALPNLSIFSYFIFARHYPSLCHQAFLPIELNPKHGVQMHSILLDQQSRFASVLYILEELKNAPLLHYTLRLMVLVMIQERHTSKDYAHLYRLLNLLFLQGYDAFVANYHTTPILWKHWILDYLPHSVEHSINKQTLGFVRTRLVGNGYVTSSTIFRLPKYSIEEDSHSEVKRSSLSQSSLRNSLVYASSSSPQKKASLEKLEDVCSQLVIHAKAVMNKPEDYMKMADYDANNSTSYHHIFTTYQQANEYGHDKYLVIIYMLVSWYYQRREHKLYTDKRSAYQLMLEVCFLLNEALSHQLNRPQPVDYRIFERLLNLELKELAGSARKLQATLLTLIPYAHLGLSLNQEELTLIDTACNIVNKCPNIFGVYRETNIKDAMVEALIEYRGTNKTMLLIATIWQAYQLTAEGEDVRKNPDNAPILQQFEHWQRRLCVAIEGAEKQWPKDLMSYIPDFNYYRPLSPSIMLLWQTLKPFIPTEPQDSDIEDESFDVLSHEHLNQLSVEESRSELKRYLSFIFSSNIHLARNYLDQLDQEWESHPRFSTAVKIVYLLLECYELHYRSNDDTGIDRVDELKNRFEQHKFAFSKSDLPDRVHNDRPMAIGYSRLRMVLFNVATPVSEPGRASSHGIHKVYGIR